MSGERTVEAAGWRESLRSGRYGEAFRAFLTTEESRNDELRQALETLASVESAVRDKAWSSAKRALERLDEPPELVDWERLSLELDTLADSSRALELRELERASELLDRVALPSLQAEVLNQRGTAHSFEGELSAARESFGRAITLDPRHYRALVNLGNAHLEAGETDQAIAYYERAIAVNDEFANAYHNLGVAYRRKGQVGRSVRYLRRAQRVHARIEGERARATMASRGVGLKALRWSLIAIAVIVVLFVLRSRGAF